MTAVLISVKKMLFNKTQNKIITNSVHYCNNFFTQGNGLMFRSKQSVKDTAWIFPFNKPKNLTVTMWFVFYPLDLVFLDKNKKILNLKSSILPFSNYKPGVKFSYLVELESGVIKKQRLKVGEKLKFD